MMKNAEGLGVFTAANGTLLENFTVYRIMLNRE